MATLLQSVQICQNFGNSAGHFDSLPDILLPENFCQPLFSLLNISSTWTATGQNVRQCLNSLLDISRSCRTCPACPVYFIITEHGPKRIEQYKGVMPNLLNMAGLEFTKQKCLSITNIMRIILPFRPTFKLQEP